jgi:sarcosine oxidase
MKTDILVIGNGMFGSAATRHMAERGHKVLCIGAPRVPASEADIQRQPSRVYSSHNDEARLTRRQDRNIAWAEVTGRAIGNYRELERRSGVSFFHDVGCLIAARPGGDGISADPLTVMNEIGVDYRLYDVGDRSWNKIWPDLSLPDTHFVAHEPAPAGYVRPKRLIHAQNVLATNAGAQLIDDTVVEVARAASGFLVRTAGNVQVEAERVVVAAGAFSNFNGLVPRTLDMTLKSEVIVLGEVTPADAARLALYPTVKFMIDPGELESIYMVPPVRYNDGRFYIKMGANTTRDVLLTRLEDVQQWFVTDTDPDFLSMFGPHLQALWPDVDFVSMRTEPCVITRTHTSLPLIENVVDGLFVAAGGNGAGAKGSDAWGERIADMIESQT